MTIRDGLQKVLKEYLTARQNEEFSQNPVASFIRKYLADSIKEACSDKDKYVTKGSASQGVWARGPWVALFNPIITTTAHNGYYPDYLFRENMQSVYL